MTEATRLLSLSQSRREANERISADLALRLNAEVNRLALHYGCTRGELLDFARRVLQGERVGARSKGDRMSVGETE